MYYLNPDGKSFRESTQRTFYVDKSLIIDALANRMRETDKFICLTRPRRFGKTMVAEMLSAFFGRESGCDAELAQLAIARSGTGTYERHKGKYDVIKIDMQGVCGHCEERNRVPGLEPITPLEFLRVELLGELATLMPDGKLKSVTISNAIREVYEHTKSEFVIIIDEWDSVLRNLENSDQLYEDYIMLLRTLFKDSTVMQAFALVYMTGILPIVRYSSQSALNNFKEFNMLSPQEFAPYVGFTKPELKELCAARGMDMAEMEMWYDGYVLKDEHLFCSNSVMDALTSGECRYYWGGTDSVNTVRAFIDGNINGVRTGLLRMINGHHVPVRTALFDNNLRNINSKDAVFTFLTHLGYLKYDPGTGECSVPNDEVQMALLNALQDSKWTKVAKIVGDADELLRATIHKDEKRVAACLRRAHANCCSLLAYNSEESLACAVTLAYQCAWTDYAVFREMPAGEGYADMVLVPRPSAGPNRPPMVIELKRNDSAGGAIAQIKNRSYQWPLEKFRQGRGKALLVGINYDPQTKEHTCKIEEAE